MPTLVCCSAGITAASAFQKSLSAVCFAVSCRGCFPQPATRLFATITDSRGHHLPSATRERTPDPLLTCNLSAQTTRVHRVPAWSTLRQQDREATRFRSAGAVVLPFFDPRGDGVSGDAKGASQSTQGAAFFVSSKNLLTALFGVSIAFGIVAAATTTVVTQVALFAVFCISVANDVLAVAVLTR